MDHHKSSPPLSSAQAQVQSEHLHSQTAHSPLRLYFNSPVHCSVVPSYTSFQPVHSSQLLPTVFPQVSSIYDFSMILKLVLIFNVFKRASIS